jgi:exodeoxyribonuclease VII small subunit
MRACIRLHAGLLCLDVDSTTGMPSRPLMPKRKPSSEQPETASFEESLGELQSIVTELEDGAIGLETSLARFERGIRLLRTCYSILEAAEAKVEILTKFQDGEPVVATFEASATFDVVRDNGGSEPLPDESTLF